MIFIWRKIKALLILPSVVSNWRQFIVNYLSPRSSECDVVFRSGIKLTIRPWSWDKSIVTETWLLDDYRFKDLKLRPGACVIDLGAHIGSFSVLAASKGAKVFALEPNPDNYRLLVRNCQQNQFKQPVTALQLAVSNKDTNQKLYLHADNNGRHSLIKAFGESITVKTVSLSSLFTKYGINRCDFLKCDIEGGEYEMFYGVDPNLLAKIKQISLEYHTGERNNEQGAALAAYLTKQGYNVKSKGTYLYAIRPDVD